MAKITGIRPSPTLASAGSSKNYVDSASGGGGSVPSGTVVMLGNASVPSGWQLCDGSELSQTTFATLFGIIGTAYNSHPTLGAPAGGNFRVPDFRDLFPLGSATRGTYSTSGWNHTHTVPAHAHTLGNHTHTLGSHSHTLPSHTHTVNNHTHTVNNHTHTYNSHTHFVNGHFHGFSLSVTVNHTHILDSVNTGTTQTTVQDPRAGNVATNANLNVASATLGTPSVGGSIGNTQNGDAGFNTNAASGTTGASNPTTSAANDTSGATAPTTSTQADGTGTPSSNTTSTDGAVATGTANPPYVGLHFMIKT